MVVLQLVLQTYLFHVGIYKKKKHFSKSLLTDAYKNPLKATEISSDIDFLKTILSLKGLLRSGAAIPLSDLTNVLQPGEIHSTEDDQFSTISPHLLEYKLHQLNSDKLIETLYIRILDFFQENLFSKLEKDMQILMEYKGKIDGI